MLEEVDACNLDAEIGNALKEIWKQETMVEENTSKLMWKKKENWFLGLSNKNPPKKNPSNIDKGINWKRNQNDIDESYVPFCLITFYYLNQSDMSEVQISLDSQISICKMK